MATKDKTPVVQRKSGQKEVHLVQEIGRAAGGSKNDEFNARILETTLPCVWIQTAAGEDNQSAQNKAVVATIAAVTAFRPTDEIEGMIAAQTVALHAASMECFRRAMLPQQSADIASKLRKDGANMARAMTDMLAALERKRGKGQQHIRVERVVVHEGGQAIVGDVMTGSTSAPAPLSVERGPAPMDMITEAEKVGVRG